jgi:DUF1680 family protein
MLMITGESQYADLIERTLYNAFLSGVSLDGKLFFYVNPLAVKDSHARQPWFRCACCPPNVMRLISAVQGYLATVRGDELQVQQYASAEIKADLPAGGSVALAMETNYPWDSAVAISITETPGSEWSLRLRIPSWCDNATVAVNGESLDLALEDSSVSIRRVWSNGDRIALTLAMSPRLLLGHPYIDATRGAAALTYGPLVYCIEAVDQPGDIDLRQVLLDSQTTLEVARRDDLLDGTSTIDAQGYALNLGDWSGQLYREAAAASATERRAVPLRFIPYHQWANRVPGPMRVWIPLA